MITIDRHLCIGGPCAGQVIACARTMDYVNVEPIPTYDLVGPQDMSQDFSFIRRYTYKRISLLDEQKILHFALLFHDTIAELLRGYMRPEE